MERDRPKGIDRLTDRDILMEGDRPKGTETDLLTGTFLRRETHNGVETDLRRDVPLETDLKAYRQTY